MPMAASITLANPYLADLVYRRIVGEVKAVGKQAEISVEGDVIKIKLEGVEELVWRIVKSFPAAVFVSIDFR
ncbi:MAG: hypothetical protein ACK4SY_00640 [Pyrobaculum sp.]